jgi:hypothetical protein
MNRIISDLPDLAQRVEKLEKANRRLKLAGVLALALVGCSLLLGAASPKRTVEAEEFILRDANGEVRALLGMIQEGPMFALYGAEAHGESRAILRMAAEGPMLTLSDENKQIRVMLGTTSNEPVLGFFDANGKVIFSVPPY